MFGFLRQRKTLDVLTLFHSPTNPASTRILNLLRDTVTKRQEADVAGDSSAPPPFELDVVEAPTLPTSQQLQSIIEYIGKERIPDVVDGARSVSEALKMIEGNTGDKVFKRPVLVDWNNGRAIAGGDWERVKKLIETKN